MKKLTTIAGAATIAAGSAYAGGIDRSSQFLGPLFEQGGATGSYVQLSYGRILPSAKAPNLNVGNPLGDYNSFGVAFKTDLNDKLSLGIIFEEPYGADIQYPLAGPFVGGGAEVNSDQISAIVRYKVSDRFSILGGFRLLDVDGSIRTFTAAPVPGGLAPISLSASSEWAIGGVVGVAYEIPDIALRVALSYNTEISADFTGTETVFADAARTIPIGGAATNFNVKFPESINLEFQSGVAQNTLVFGSIRHAMYNGFNLTTPANAGIFGGLLGATNYVNFTSDSTTYSLGVGRRFNDKFSGSISFSYEADGTIPSTTALAPTTGLSSVSIGGQYKATDTMTISGGISYIVPGDQLVNSAAGQASFNNNEVIAVGLRLGINF